MRKRWLSICLAFVATTAPAQVPSPDALKSAIILKITPLALFDLDNTVQLGVEVPLKNPAWSLQQEMGYGHSAFNLWYSERQRYPDRETWRFRTQIRYYFLKQNRNSPYMAGEYLLKKNMEGKYRSVGMDCSTTQFGGQNCAYFQNRRVHLARFVNAFHLKLGWQFSIGNRMALDTYVGAGIRALQVKYVGLPPNSFFNGRRDFLTFRNDWPGRYGPTPSLSAGFHIGWRL